MASNRSVLLALLLAGCPSAHVGPSDAGREDPDAPPSDAGCTVMPPELVGRFDVVGEHCRDELAPSLSDLVIGECGEIYMEIPDGMAVFGSLRREGAGYRYVHRSPHGDPRLRDFRVGVLSDHRRAGQPVLLLENVDPAADWARAWAVAQPRFGGGAATAPRVAGCAVRETWTRHSLDETTVGPALDAGTETFASGARLRLGDWTSGGVTFSLEGVTPLWSARETHIGLVTTWDTTPTGAEAGVAVLWDGWRACAELDADIELEWDGETLVSHIDWVSADVADADADGRTDDFVVRRSRTEYSPDACP